MGSVCSSIECPPSIQTYKFPGILIFYFVATVAHITMVDLCPLPPLTFVLTRAIFSLTKRASMCRKRNHLSSLLLL